MNQRARVISVYKQLYHLGKEYPKGKDWFHTRLKAAFLKNQHWMVWRGGGIAGGDEDVVEGDGEVVGVEEN
ncbi:hypothetical protein OSTOST_11269, partial [Ostertagia ostertagi]